MSKSKNETPVGPEFLLNFRHHTNLDGVSDPIQIKLGIVAELIADDDGFYRALSWSRQGCDLFDPLAMARWAHENSFLDYEEMRAVERALKPFLTAEEAQTRLLMADGHCPMCGTEVVFHKEGNFGNFSYRTTHRCGHFVYDHVSNPSIVRDATAWQGARWPFSFGQKWASDDGQPLHGEGISICCDGCRIHSARDMLESRVEAVLIEFVKAGRKEEYRSKYKCSPTSQLDPFAKDKEAPEVISPGLLKYLRARAHKIVELENSEMSINGAGLKLYGQGLKKRFGRMGQIQFSMRVGGDQANLYPPFVAFANGLIEAQNLSKLVTDGSQLTCEAA